MKEEEKYEMDGKEREKRRMIKEMKQKERKERVNEGK